jgi:glycosyltransferase involved in cell wall biosynthesis
VLTTYNRAAVLGSTIEAVLNQTFSDFELIICDDCSPDHTESLCQAYQQKDKRIRYVRNEQNLGMPNNLNLGLKLARARYIANLHDGDVYSPELLERWMNGLNACPAAGFVFNAYRALDDGGREGRVYREKLDLCTPGDVILEKLFFKRWRFNSPIWGTCMVRKEAYEQVGFLSDRHGIFADVDLWLRLAESFHVAYVSEPLIGLPSRDALPSNWSLGVRQEKSVVENIFWEARLRHYRDRGLRKTLELLRHMAHVAASRPLTYVIWTWRRKVTGGGGRVP